MKLDFLKDIKVIIGLGNPGPKFYYNRHNIGFRILDSLCQKSNCSWQLASKMEKSEIQINDKNILLVKPQTFMNSSGEVISILQKKGINPENILVIHDELELPFGQIKFKFGGSAKGHNGLKSIISFLSQDFARLRIGIGRPENREEVPDYVLSDFSEGSDQVDYIINKSVNDIILAIE